MRLVHGWRTDNLRGDLAGGVTAAVVALPLALAFGVASGAGPIAGLYGAVIVGLLAALFGGTPSQISGPTGPMTIVMAAIIVRYGEAPAIAFTIVALSGLLQMGFGLLRLGHYINLVPFTVISGFMTGIGCIIIILQLPALLGHSHPGADVLGSLQALPQDLVSLQPQALAIGLGTLLIVALTPHAIGRFLPPPLLALLLGTFAALLFLPEAPTLGPLPTGLPVPQIPVFDVALWADMIAMALVLALLGSIDSLLTSLVADGITRTHHDSDRELLGQGVGNLAAGLLGAVPGAGATMRTVVNIRSGGRTPLSGMVHALMLLVVVLGLGPFAAHIPEAVLAGILVKVGIDIIDWRYLRRLWRAPRAGVVIMLIVLLLTVFVDLIVAVAVGTVAASLLLVKQMSDQELNSVVSGTGRLPYSAEEKAILDRQAHKVLIYHFAGALHFAAAKGLTRLVVIRRDYSELVLDLSDVPHVDTSAAMAFEEIIATAEDLGLKVALIGLHPRVRQVLEALEVMDLVPPEQCFDDRLTALRRIDRDLGGVAPDSGA